MFWQFFLSILPINITKKTSIYVNPLLDVLFTVFSYFIFLKLNICPFKSFLLACLYLFTPSWFSRLSTGPRIQSLTPRLFSEIISNLVFIIALFPLELPPIIKGLLLIVFIFIQLTSSLFGIQVVLFMLIPLSLLIKERLVIISIIIAVFLCITLGRKSYLNLLRDHALFLLDYRRKVKEEKTNVATRNSIKIALKSLSSSNNILFDAIRIFLIQNSFSSTTIKMPVFLIACFDLAKNISIKSNLDLLIFISFIVFILINTKPFLFLGEAERYLNHISIPIILKFGQSAKSESILLLILFGFLYWIFEIFYFKKRTKSLPEKEERDILNLLNKTQKSLNVALYPYHAVGAWKILYETRCRVLYPVYLEKEDVIKFKKFEGEYPFFDISKLEELIKCYKIDVLIINKNYAHLLPGGSASQLTKIHPAATKSGFYEVYSINNSQFPKVDPRN